MSDVSSLRTQLKTASGIRDRLLQLADFVSELETYAHQQDVSAPGVEGTINLAYEVRDMITATLVEQHKEETECHRRLPELLKAKR